MIDSIKYLQELVPSIFPTHNPFILFVSEDKYFERPRSSVRIYSQTEKGFKETLKSEPLERSRLLRFSDEDVQKVWSRNGTWPCAKPGSFYNADLPVASPLSFQHRRDNDSSLMLYREPTSWSEVRYIHRRKPANESVTNAIKIEGGVKGRTSMQKWKSTMMARRLELTCQNAPEKVGDSTKASVQINSQLCSTDKMTPVKGGIRRPRLKLEPENTANLETNGPQTQSLSHSLNLSRFNIRKKTRIIYDS